MFSRLGFLARERIDALCLAIKRVKSSFDFGEKESFYFLTLPMWQALRKSKKNKKQKSKAYI